MDQREVVLYSLGIFDLILCVLTVLQLVVLILREKHLRKLGEEPSSNNGQKLFHGTLVVCLLVRGLFLLIQPSVYEGKVNMSSNLSSIWSHAGQVLFFVVYFMLLLLWMNFYYMVSQTFETNIKVRVLAMCLMCSFVIFVVPVYFILEIVWGAQHLDVSNYNVWVAVVFAILEMLIVIAFAIYGIYLKMALRTQTQLLPEQRQRIKKVSFVAAFCSISFGCRAILVFVSVFQNVDYFSKGYFFHTDWYFLLAYFMAFEILPSIVIIYLLGNLPQWKVSDYYEAERASLLYNERHEMRESQVSNPSTWK